METKVTNRKTKQRVDAFKTPKSINDFLERNPDYKVTQLCSEGDWIYVVFTIEEEPVFTYKAHLGGREL